MLLHAAHRARRGRSDRTSVAIRTSRERAKPHGDNGPEQAGHTNSPAAKTASTHCCVIAIESIEDLWLAHRRRTLPERVAAGKGRFVLHTYHSHAEPARKARSRRPHRERREPAIPCPNRTALNTYFEERTTEVCGLYLDPPAGALVLSIDEKTSI